MEIEVVPYDARWPELFQQECLLLKESLGSNLYQCYHIGSTAVSKLSAKPVIDILLVVRDLGKLDEHEEVLRHVGYESFGENGISHRRFYVKGKNKRTHHVHGLQADNVNEIIRHLVFRDYLRQHSSEANQYGQLKKELARTFADDRRGYVSGKDERKEGDCLVLARE